MENKDILKENVKLVHNTKGYTWEIKATAMSDHWEEEDLKRLKKIDDDLQDEFGIGGKNYDD